MGEVKRLLGERMARCAAGRRVEHDPEWASPCEFGEPDAAGMIRWRPVEMVPAPDFREVEAATEVMLPAAVKEFFGSYFGKTDQFGFRGEAVLLRTIWNAEDLEAFKRDMVEHIRLCPTIPAPTSVYFANSDGDPFYSVDLATGEVLFEEPDWPRSTVVAPSLAASLGEPRP